MVQYTLEIYDTGIKRLNSNLGSTQFLSILSVSLKSVDKSVKGKLKGVVKVLLREGEKNAEGDFDDDECK